MSYAATWIRKANKHFFSSRWFENYLKSVCYLFFKHADARLCDSNVTSTHERHKLKLTAGVMHVLPLGPDNDHLQPLRMPCAIFGYWCTVVTLNPPRCYEVDLFWQSSRGTEVSNSTLQAALNVYITTDVSKSRGVQVWILRYRKGTKYYWLSHKRGQKYCMSFSMVGSVFVTELVCIEMYRMFFIMGQFINYFEQIHLFSMLVQIYKNSRNSGIACFWGFNFVIYFFNFFFNFTVTILEWLPLLYCAYLPK